MEVHSLERLLRRHSFFQSLTDDQVAFLTGCAENVKLPAGSFLYREGQPADRCYLIREGRVSFEVHDPRRGSLQLGQATTGELTGWGWLFPPYQFHLDARALTVVRAIAMDGECLRQKCEEDHDLGYAFVKAILFQVHKRLEQSRMQVLDVYGESD